MFDILILFKFTISAISANQPRKKMIQLNKINNSLGFTVVVRFHKDFTEDFSEDFNEDFIEDFAFITEKLAL